MHLAPEFYPNEPLNNRAAGAAMKYSREKCLAMVRYYGTLILRSKHEAHRLIYRRCARRWTADLFAVNWLEANNA